MALSADARVPRVSRLGGWQCWKGMRCGWETQNIASRCCHVMSSDLSALRVIAPPQPPPTLHPKSGCFGGFLEIRADSHGSIVGLKVSSATCPLLRIERILFTVSGTDTYSLTKEERMGAVVIPADRLAVTVSEAARLTSLSRGTIRNYARHGRIKVVKVGRRTIVPIATLQSLVREGLNSQ